ncbi:PLD nuclease N-terminal domain-containing protein [Actinomyces sp. MRS3W]|uniref:PLD nuclease N-terminal domain-containing protein n=1 Tax=Actinomyces sp. MRS3W TaxID=2800796 RepID=UPI0028FD51C7|nr:PLD nuclease N-terminal domain-containing protein [Actinomyces sp. MRS3W]MDU0349010.1 PLD nuclease N-terminal domain-containing protein [Actinomyces sp. MRS3W]
MRAVPYILVLALALYALIDCVRTPSENMPAHLPKPMWILLILVMIGVGPIAWIITSRVRAAEEHGGEIERTVWSSQESVRLHLAERPRPVAPDDDPEFLARLERDIRRQRKDGTSDSAGRDDHGNHADPGDDPNAHGGAGGPGIPSDDSPES